MKKKIALVMIISLLAVALVACGEPIEDAPEAPEEEVEEDVIIDPSEEE
ncbi:hypothetical protein [Fuchsiella alkaliacetigena]|nr:hypothetical protein [Fuchsiella alkaliacetigena]MCK8824420.1 hypothetical protein [Fuchsiella alkaliacetigena]